MTVSVSRLGGGYKNSYDETWKFPVNLKRGDLYSSTERSDGIWYGVIDIHKERMTDTVMVIVMPTENPLTLGPKLQTSEPIFAELNAFEMVKTLTNGKATPVDGGIVEDLNY